MIDKIIGNYRIIRKIGEGGMGTVFLAKDLTLEREVALKIINPTFASNSRLMARFKIEAIAQARLNHPNVITIFSFEQVGDLYFIVMEYIEGESLKDIIKKKKLTPEKALHIFRQVLNAIEFAHRKGIIHRDIKPGNIIITRDWIARIGDFGIAKIEGVEGLTREGTSLGTPLYSSPEQILGKNVDLRTDIYSLGVVLFEMLTGRPPFISEKGSEYEIQKAHIEQLPPRPSSINPLIPYKMDKIILKCLEKEPEKRYETVSELLQDFIKISARDFKFSKFAFLRSLVEFFDKTKLFFRGFSQELRTNRKFFYLTLSVLILSLLLVIILATSKVSEPLESRGLYPSVSTLKNKEEPQNAKGVESLKKEYSPSNILKDPEPVEPGQAKEGVEKFSSGEEGIIDQPTSVSKTETTHEEVTTSEKAKSPKRITPSSTKEKTLPSSSIKSKAKVEVPQGKKQPSSKIKSVRKPVRIRASAKNYAEINSLIEGRLFYKAAVRGEQLLKRYPADGMLYLYTGRAYFLMRNYKKARMFYSRAYEKLGYIKFEVKLLPGMSDVESVGWLYVRKGYLKYVPEDFKNRAVTLKARQISEVKPAKKPWEKEWKLEIKSVEGKKFKFQLRKRMGVKEDMDLIRFFIIKSTKGGK